MQSLQGGADTTTVDPTIVNNITRRAKPIADPRSVLESSSDEEEELSDNEEGVYQIFRKTFVNTTKTRTLYNGPFFHRINFKSNESEPGTLWFVSCLKKALAKSGNRFPVKVHLSVGIYLKKTDLQTGQEDIKYFYPNYETSVCNILYLNKVNGRIFKSIEDQINSFGYIAKAKHISASQLGSGYVFCGVGNLQISIVKLYNMGGS